MVIQPSTGNILAMVSNPTFDPNPLASTSLQAEQLAYSATSRRTTRASSRCGRIATGETLPPGSTMKVVTSTAAYNLKPALAGFNYPVQQCQKFSDSDVSHCATSPGRAAGR